MDTHATIDRSPTLYFALPNSCGRMDEVMTVKAIEGGCYCRAIRYRIDGAPSSSMICHCQSCRKIAAAPVVAWITVKVSDFVVVKGTPAQLASSPPVRRTFCSSCGTHLTYAHTKEVETLDITTCSLDHPNAFPPTHHSWVSHDLKWIKFGDGLPTFPESRY
jgi:hypothetical protein